MNGHVVATVVWLALIAGGYFAFDHFSKPVVVAGCEGRGTNSTLRLEASRDGHYYVDGAIDGTEVRFVVDTGASTITVGGADADRIGLPDGVPAGFHTAAGDVPGRMVRGRRVQVACFDLPAVSVAVSPPMTGNALLGQNFLKHFEMNVSGGTMVLRPRPSD